MPPGVANLGICFHRLHWQITTRVFLILMCWCNNTTCLLVYFLSYKNSLSLSGCYHHISFHFSKSFFLMFLTVSYIWWSICFLIEVFPNMPLTHSAHCASFPRFLSSSLELTFKRRRFFIWPQEFQDHVVHFVSPASWPHSPELHLHASLAGDGARSAGSRCAPWRRARGGRWGRALAHIFEDLVPRLPNLCCHLWAGGV